MRSYFLPAAVWPSSGRRAIRQSLLIGLLLVLPAVLLSRSANAAPIDAATACTKTFTGGSGGTGTSWNTAGNWSPSGVPGAADFACLPNTATTTVTIANGVTAEIDGFSADRPLTVASGGSLVLDGPGASTANAAFTLNGLLAGAGQLMLNSTATWGSTGSQGGGGTTTIAPTGALSIATGSTGAVWSGARTIANNGAVAVTGTGGLSYQDCSGAGVIANAGTFDIQGNLPITYSCVSPAFNNTGTLKKSTSTGASDLFVALTNLSGGNVTATAGTLRLAGGPVLRQGSSAGATAGTVAITSVATVPAAETASVPVGSTLTLAAGGTIGGDGTLSVAGTLNWTGGTMSGPGSTVIAGGANLNMTPTGDNLNVSGNRQITNNGTSTYTPSTAGYVLLFNDCAFPGTFTNNGAFTYAGNATTDTSITYSCVAGQIVNAGTFTKSGSHVDTIWVSFENDGTVTASAGTLNLSGGGGDSSHVSTGAYAGAGTLGLASGETLLGDGVSFSGGASIAGGTALVNGSATATSINLSAGTLGGTGTLTVSGLLNWTGGTMSGPGSTVIAGGANLNMTPTGDNLNVSGNRQITNNGTSTYTPSTAGYVLLFNDCAFPGTFTNNGAFTYAGNATTDTSITYSCVAGQIVNAGTFTKTGPRLATLFTPFENATGGDVTATGGTLNLGTPTLSGGTLGASGSGVVLPGTATIPVSATATVPAGRTLTLSSGQTVGGDGTLSVAGTLNWTGGTMSGPGSTVIAGGANLNLTPTGDNLNVSGNRQIMNNGTSTYTPSTAGYVLLFNDCVFPGTFTNNATFTYIGTTTFNASITSSCVAGQFVNSATGTFVKSAGTKVDTVMVPFDNSGTVQVSAGQLSFSGGFAAYDGATQTLVKGTYRVIDPGILTWNGADVVKNAASITLDGANAKLLDESAQSGLRNLAQNLGTGSITVKNGRALVAKAFSNAGAVVVGGGTNASFSAPTYTQSAGSTSLTDATSKLIATGGTPSVAVNGGTLSGIGTVQGNLANNAGATVAPGLSPGTLTVTGAYTQAGTLAEEVAGTGAGSFDKLAVSGNATINSGSTLAVSTSYAAAKGDSMSFITCGGTCSGSFTTVTGRDLGGGLFYQLATSAADLKLTVARAELTVNDVSLTEGDTGTTNAVFTVTLSPSRPDLSVTVPFSLAAGTATSGADYGPAVEASPLVFTAGQTSKTITVPVNGDTLDEDDETFFVNLGTPANGFVVDGQGQATILDDDIAQANLSLTNVDSPDPVVADSPLTYTLTVTNAGPSDATNVTVTDTLPSTVIVGTLPAGCSGTATVTCSLGTIANGSNAQVVIPVTPIEPGSITATASATATEADPVPANNTAIAAKTTVSAQAQTKYIDITDSGFPAVTPNASNGWTVQFNFLGTQTNSVKDNSGLGLFDSGPMTPRSYYRFKFTAAGRYALLDGLGHAGAASVKLTGNSTGTLGAPFTVQWASQTAPAGFVYDVQYQQPGSSTWINLLVGSTARNATFTPTAATGGAGTYTFRARYRKTSVTPNVSSGYSNGKKVVVT